MPTHDFKDIGDVLNFDILRGTITSIDAETDTCEVTVGGRSVTALLFYHCEPDSILRDNGAIEGAAAGFAEDDEVIVMVSKVDDTVKVIAHVDGVRHCGEYIIYYCSAEVYIESTNTWVNTTAGLVWNTQTGTVFNISTGDPDNPKLDDTFDIEDPAFVDWYASKEDIGDVLLTNNVTIQGNDPYGYRGNYSCQYDYEAPDGAYYSYLKYALWTRYLYTEDKIPGRTIASNWPYDEMYDFGRNYQTLDSYQDVGENHNTYMHRVYTADVNAYTRPVFLDPSWALALDGYLGPNSVYGLVTISNGQKAFVRSAVEIDIDNQFWNYNNGNTRGQDFEQSIKRTWYSPWGEMDVFTSITTRRWNGDYATSSNAPTTMIGIPYYCYPTRMVYGAATNFYRVNWDFAKHYGITSEKSISYAAVVVYCSLQHNYNVNTNNIQSAIDEVVNYNGERQVIVHANAIWRSEGDAKTFDPTTESRDSDLELALADLVNKSCELAGLPTNKMPIGLTFTMKAVK